MLNFFILNKAQYSAVREFTELDVFNWTPNPMPDTDLKGSIMLQYIYQNIRNVEPF